MLSVAQAIHHSEAQGSTPSKHSALSQSWSVDGHNTLKRRKIESDSIDESIERDIESIESISKCFNFNSTEVTLTAIPKGSSHHKEQKSDHFQGQIKISPLGKLVEESVTDESELKKNSEVLTNIPPPVVTFFANSTDVVLTKLGSNQNVKLINSKESNNNELCSVNQNGNFDTNGILSSISNPLKGFSEVTIEPRTPHKLRLSESDQSDRLNDTQEKDKIRPKITKAAEYLKMRQTIPQEEENTCKDSNNFDSFSYSRPSIALFDEPADPLEDIILPQVVVDYEPFNVGVLALDYFSKNNKPHYAAGFPNPPGENRCWINATLQALFALPEIGGLQSSHLPEGSKLMTTFNNIQKAWRNGFTENPQFNRTFNNFKKELSLLDTHYSSKAQQDVSEFIMNLLNFIKTEFDNLIEKQSHENEIENVPNNDQDLPLKSQSNGLDLNGRLPLVDISSKQIPNAQPCKYNRSSLDEIPLKNNSFFKIKDNQIKSNPIDEYFLLNMVENYQCDNCFKDRSQKIENLMLFIDLPEKNNENVVSLVDLINKTYTEESRNIVCECCKHSGQTMQIKFKKLPKVLTIQVKRYEMTENGHIIKKNTLVQIPEFLRLDSLKMNNSDFDYSPVYEAVGVISHIGDSIDSGHYISFVKHEDQWFYYDDITVKVVSTDDVINCVQNNVYVLFFQDMDLGIKFDEKYQDECTIR